MKKIISLLCFASLILFSNSSYSQSNQQSEMDPLIDVIEPEQEYSTRSQRPRLQLDIQIRPFSEEILSEDWAGYFDNIIFINRAIHGIDSQTLRLYRFGEIFSFGNDLSGQPIFSLPISSGKIINGRSATPLGYFTPTFLSLNHISSISGAPMPFAVFFINGYAIHRVPMPHQESLLGSAVSTGCVRVSKEFVPQIYELVQSSGQGQIPVVSRNGTVSRNKDGSLKTTRGFKTLIIVDDQIIE